MDRGRQCPDQRRRRRRGRRGVCRPATSFACASRTCPKRARPQAQALDLDILYEDDDLLAVNKPAGLVVHPSFGNTSGTLMNGLLDLARSWPGGSKPALLGRLDKHTSGIVLVTKRGEIHAALQRAMNARRIDKDYLAIVCGKPPQRGTIDLALDRDPWDRRRVTVTDRGGQPSVTKYERLLDGQRIFARAMPSDHRPHASDPRAPGREALADRRRCDVRREIAGSPASIEAAATVSAAGAACVAPGISPAAHRTRDRRSKRRCRRT